MCAVTFGFGLLLVCYIFVLLLKFWFVGLSFAFYFCCAAYTSTKWGFNAVPNCTMYIYAYNYKSSSIDISQLHLLKIAFDLKSVIFSHFTFSHTFREKVLVSISNRSNNRFDALVFSDTLKSTPSFFFSRVNFLTVFGLNFFLF